MHFPGQEKSWFLGKMAKVIERSHFTFSFGPNISSCLKTGSILFVIEQKYAPKRLGFQHFLVMESLISHAKDTNTMTGDTQNHKQMH